MKKILFFLLTLSVFTAYSQGINQTEYQQRREKVILQLDTASAVVMRSADYKRSPYAQDPDFLYLTGLKRPNCVLILSQKGIKMGTVVKNVLFFSLDKKMDETFIAGQHDTTLGLSALKFTLGDLFPKLNKLYLSAPDIDKVNDWINGEDYNVSREMRKKLTEKYPNVKVLSASTLIAPLREIKSENEITLMQKAADITADGLKDAIKTCKPNMYEYELQAAIEYQYTKQGAMQKAFGCIIGSGTNSLILHYMENIRKMEAKDFVVMDVGAKYQEYCTDITRTIPVSGKFNPAQKEIYEMVLSVQKAVIEQVKPGVTLAQLNDSTRVLFKQMGYLNYFIHGVTHSVGLEVHDVETDRPLEPGMVITIEPGLYFPVNDKKIPVNYGGYGVRIEDTVLVTANGCKVLTSKVPKEIKEIEALMKK